MQNVKTQTIYFSTYDDIKNPYYGGGGALAIHEVAKRVAKKHNVRVISWDYNGRKKEIIDTIHYEKFGSPYFGPKIAMFIYQLCLPFVMKSKKFDVWFESFCPPFTTSYLPLFTSKPVVGIVHMLAAEDMERKYKLPFQGIENSGLKKYKYLISTSETVRKKIKLIGSKSKITVISNGISKVITPKKRKQKYILFLGRIEIDQKGLDLLLAGFRKFYNDNKHYQLIIAGSGDPKEIKILKETIQKKSLEKVVILKGRVSGKIKEKLITEAASIVIPSRFETFSLVALEAMAYGAPIICFSISGLSWIPKGLANKVRIYNVDELADAMSDIISERKKTNQMILNAHEYVKQFSWDAIAKKYVDYIDELEI